MSASVDLERMLESEGAFRAYLAKESGIRQAYKVCKHLIKVAGEAFDERDQHAAERATREEKLSHMAAEVARLNKKVEEQRDARMRMEGVLTYVEDQLSTL